MSENNFSIPSEWISKGEVPSDKEIKKVEEILGYELPKSFISFLKLFGQKIGIKSRSGDDYSGNLLTNALLPMNEDDRITSVAYSAKENRKFNSDLGKNFEDFIIFGGDGNDGLFAFHSKFKQGDEYPIIKYSMGQGDEDNAFTIMATNFSSFVNTYIHLEILRSTQEEENDEKMLKVAKKLVEKNDPKMGVQFAEQLVSWEWEELTRKELDNKLSSLLEEKK